jgi:hypothetical protein
MQITNIFSSAYPTTSQLAPSVRTADTTVTSSPAGAAGGGVSSYDFTNLMPKALQSTINDLVKSGKLSLKDSSPLLTIAGFVNGGGVSGAAAQGADQPIDVLSALKAGISYKQQTQANTPIPASKTGRAR